MLRGDSKADAGRVEELLPEFVAVAPNLENHCVAEKSGVVDGRDSGRIGEKKDFVRGSQFDEGDAAARGIVGDVNNERFRGLCAGGRRREEAEWEQADGEWPHVSDLNFNGCVAKPDQAGDV